MPRGIHKNGINKGQFIKGFTPWNKGLVGIQIGARKGVRLSDETKKKISKSNARIWQGKHLSEETKEKISAYWKGRAKTDEQKQKIRDTIKARGICRKENNPNWKGGKNPDKHCFTFEYSEWRAAVFARDNFKCRIADEKCKGQLEAHHILRWSEYPELRYQINNGITLCHAHHPRAKSEEKRLTPYFNGLVSVSNLPRF